MAELIHVSKVRITKDKGAAPTTLDHLVAAVGG